MARDNSSIFIYMSEEKMEEAISYIVSSKLNGVSYDTLFFSIRDKFNLNDDRTVKYLIDKSDEFLKKASVIDFESIVYAHVYLYENLYFLFGEIDDKGGQLRALRQKEELLSLNKEYEELKTSVNQALSERSGEQEYNFSQLTENENARFDFLKNKMKK